MATIEQAHKPFYAFVATGVSAIVLGGLISAFTAKQPSTFAMWTSAYLVLVAGVVPVFFGLTLSRLTPNLHARFIYSVCALFAAANVLMITGSAIKYSGLGWNMPVTAAGSGAFVVALVLLGACIYSTRWSWLRVWTYVVIIVLGISVPIGFLLARQ